MSFAISEHGSLAEVLTGEKTVCPNRYYAMMVPSLLRKDPRRLIDESNERSWNISPRPPELIRPLTGSLSVSLTVSFRMRSSGKRRADHLKSCSTVMASTPCSMNKSRRTFERDGSAWRRIACPSVLRSRMWIRAMSKSILERQSRHITLDRIRGACVRGCRGPHAGGRCRKPLDERARAR